MKTKFLYILFLFMALAVRGFAQPNWFPLGVDSGRVSGYVGVDDNPRIITDTGGVPIVVYSNTSYFLPPLFATTHRTMKFVGGAWTAVAQPDSFLRYYQADLYRSPKGNIYLAGRNDADTNYKNIVVARLDGNVWTKIGSTIYANSYVANAQVVVDSNDKVYCGFSNDFGAPGGSRYAARIYTYDSTVGWTTVGNDSFMHNTSIMRMRLGPGNQLYVGYDGQSQNYASHVQKWDGSNWSIVGQPVRILAHLDIGAEGIPYIGTYVSVNSPSLRCQVSRLDTNTNNWMPLGELPIYYGLDYFNDMVLDEQGMPHVAFKAMDDPCSGVKGGILKWDGTNWVGDYCLAPSLVDDMKLAFGKGRRYVVYLTSFNRVYVMRYGNPASLPELINPGVGASSAELYPNPAGNTVTITVGQAGSLKLTDMVGRSCIRMALQPGAHSLDISHLATGVYLWIFHATDGASQQGKLLVDQ